MTDRSVKPTVYLLKPCPFCLKLRIFLTEAGIADGVTFMTFDAGDAVEQDVRQRIEATGGKASFPAAEFAPGEFITETDVLIDRFASEAGVNPTSLPLLNYYAHGVFEAYVANFRELHALKAAPVRQDA